MFAVFAGHNHYPLGGWKDLEGLYGTWSEAHDRMPALANHLDWVQIVDLDECKIVTEWQEQT